MLLLAVRVQLDGCVLLTASDVNSLYKDNVKVQILPSKSQDGKSELRIWQNFPERSTEWQEVCGWLFVGWRSSKNCVDIHRMIRGSRHTFSTPIRTLISSHVQLLPVVVWTVGAVPAGHRETTICCGLDNSWTGDQISMAEREGVEWLAKASNDKTLC